MATLQHPPLLPPRLPRWQAEPEAKPMDVLYLLIPLSVVLVLGIIALFWWALHSGQFDHVEREGERILDGD